MLATTEHPPQSKPMAVVLIKPSKYHADGYLLEWGFGILPCNSLAVMTTLTEAAFARPELAGANCSLEVFDETTRRGRVYPERIMEKHRGAKVIVGLVAVQTNMFPRACDLARRFQALGATVVIGGFHVSGNITMLHDGGQLNDDQKTIPCPRLMPPECQELMDSGVIIFHGEAEAIWHEALLDIYRGEPKLLYRGGKPNIENAPLPRFPESYHAGFLGRRHTLDTGRGCPFKCSFCVVIRVQGNEPRYRNVKGILTRFREICEVESEGFFFLTDDNQPRNPLWAEILHGLIALRQAGHRFTFMVEADLAAWRKRCKCCGESFPNLLGAAGCSQVFMGVESVDQRALQAVRKYQNRVDEYAKICRLYHEAGVATHAGYIIGFPTDTPESVRESIETLKETGFDIASFFLLTPLPGSEDHVRQYIAGVKMDPDYNAYDSFEPVTDHPLMSRGEWLGAYQEAWGQFYSIRQVVRAIRQAPPRDYQSHLLQLFWYRFSAIRERIHPMNAGLYRFRNRRERRPGAPAVSALRYWLEEARRHLWYVWAVASEAAFIAGVYLLTMPEAHGWNKQRPDALAPNLPLIGVRGEDEQEEKLLRVV